MNHQIPWLRIMAEGAAIVVSILLAFGIQAWWEGRGERQLEASYLSGLSRELQASIDEADGDLEHRRATKAFVERLLAPDRDERPLSSDSIAMMIGTLRYGLKYSPPTGVLEDLISSGRLGLLGSDSIRVGLQRYRQELDKLRIEEQEEREFIAQQLSPYLTVRMDLAPAYLRGQAKLEDPLVPVDGNLAPLLDDPVLRNLLHQRTDLGRVPEGRIQELRILSLRLLEWVADRQSAL